jgi:hypothetical protein
MNERDLESAEPASHSQILPPTRNLDFASWNISTSWAAGLLALLTLAVFADIVFFGQGRVLSALGYDLSSEFVYWRDFGFRELKAGNLALWNPHCYSGTPFFGGFQSALLYPLNVLFLVLPLGPAINWSIALHVWLAGMFTFLWTRHRGLHSLACLLAAIMFMFGGPYFLHIYAGHLPNLGTMIWTPVLFLALDTILNQPSLGATLLGMFAVAMAILAGHIQYVFYMSVGAVVYCALHLASKCRSLVFPNLNAPVPGSGPAKSALPGLLKTVCCLSLIWLGAVALTAVQLLTGIQESHENVRAPGAPFEFASMFSFPPENFLTFVAPWFFGNLKASPYWGRCYLFEMSCFVSLTGLVLAIAGAVWGDRKARRFSLVLVLVTLCLALGAHTPLFSLLYKFVPGFDKFRGSSKFIFLSALFLSMLAAIGLDRLLKGNKVPRGLIWGSLAGAVILGGVWFCFSSDSSIPDVGSWWPRVIMGVRQTGEIFRQAGMPADLFESVPFAREAGAQAARSVGLAAAVLFALAGLLFLSRYSRCWLLAAGLVGVVEMIVFARSSLVTFDLAQTRSAYVQELLKDAPGDYRILHSLNPNSAMSLGAYDIMGDDPGMLRRYAEFLAFSQGDDPDEVQQNVPIRHVPPAFAMLRCRFVLQNTKEGIAWQEVGTPPLQQLQLVGGCQVLTNKNDILRAVTSPRFNARQEVVLETRPDLWPEPSGTNGTVKLLGSTTDELVIEADLPAPAILLVTEAFSAGWQARSLLNGDRRNYPVLPANYCLRAIPLAAGHHELRLEYLPAGFVIGKWVSLASVFLFLALLGLDRLTGRRSGSAPGRRRLEPAGQEVCPGSPAK